MPTIFTRIISGEIPCFKIYEDDRTFAFLNNQPVQPGHILVIPKKPIEFIWDLPDDDYQALMAVTKKIALHMRQTLHVPYIHERVVGTDVPHAHVHLIPFATTADIKQPGQVDPDPQQQADLAAKLSVS